MSVYYNNNLLEAVICCVQNINKLVAFKMDIYRGGLNLHISSVETFSEPVKTI